MPITVIIVAIVAIAGAGLFFLNNEPTPENTHTEVVAEEPLARTDVETPAEVTSDSDEVSGSAGNHTPEESIVHETAPTPAPTVQTYTAEAGYLTPARQELSIEVSLTVDSDGVITDADVTYDGKQDGYSNPNQKRFDDAYERFVIGEEIDGLELSQVGGSSLTTGAFNDALDKIRAQGA